jgi:DNA invertase Pin-like site-specific DNA recombinase
MVEINGIHAKNFCDYIYQDKYFGLNRKYNKYLILVELFNNSKTILNNIKKNEALRLYNGGIPITKIIKATGIPNTTLRRFLSKIK